MKKNKNRRYPTVATSLLLTSFSCATLMGANKEKPNMLIFIADDHGRDQSQAYGDTQALTPNMAKMAQEGITFNRAYVASPTSGPSRSALLSSQFNARNGAIYNHQLPIEETQQMVRQLQDQGYEVVAIGKVSHSHEHAAMQGYDYVKHFISKRDLVVSEVRKYLEARKSDKPLCLMVGDGRPHVSWTTNPIYNEDEITLPPKIYDTPETREHFARYLTDITTMDRAMGKVDSLMTDYCGKDNYLFAYTADHGAQWPFGKFTLYERGLGTSLIVRWNDKIKPNTRTDAMVSWIDIFPTLIEIAGGEATGNIDGYSFLDVLKDKKKKHRKYIYGSHMGDGKMNIYPIRSVTDGKYKYIRNLRPDCYFSNHSDISRKDGAGAYWYSWDIAEKKDPAAAKIIDKYYIHPAEELYDISIDPDEQNNLIGKPEIASIRRKLSKKLDNWMEEIDDTQELKMEPYPLTGPRPYEVNKQKM